jgi:uncharacterized membrane protein HdeD (DUF308 family)
MSMGNEPLAPPGGPRAIGPPLIFLGVLRLILGVLALMAPLAAGIAIEIIIGVVILFAGVGALLHAFQSRHWEGALVSIIGGVLAILCGLLMLAHPIAGLNFLTILLAVYFVLEGITMLLLAFRLSPMGGSGWLWALFGGVISLLLGILIWAQWPLSGVWAVGTLVGINLLLTGWMALVLGMAARRA